MKKLNILCLIIILMISLTGITRAQDTTMTPPQGMEDTTMQHPDHHGGMMGEMGEEMKEMHEEMMEMEMTGDPDYDFAQLMIEHHKGAIKLSEKQVDEGEADSVVALAREIIEDQQDEIDSLEEFVDNHEPQKSDDTEMTGGGDHLMKDMDEMMLQMQEMEMQEDQDHNYVEMITMHHRQAIKMAENYLSHGKDENLKRMAQDMIDKNQEQITKFDSWKMTHE